MTKFSPAQGRQLPLVVLTLMVVAALAAWAALSWPGLLSLHRRWLRFDEPYALGYPALLLSLWWLYRHRDALLLRGLSPAWPAVAAVAGAALLLAMGILVQLQLLQQLGALALLWAAALLVTGWRAGRLLLFPAMLMALAIPLWDFLVDPLRSMTVWFTQHILDAMQLPAHIDGFFITLPAGIVEVAGGCSGLNLLLAMALMGLLFAESHYLPRTRRIAIVAAALALGVLENWIRVVALVLVAYYSDMHHPLVKQHGNFGWWIFAGGLLPFFWLAGRIERGAHAVATSRRQQATSSQSGPDRVGMARALAVVALVIVAVQVLTVQLQGRRGAAVAGFVAPPGVATAEPKWLPAYSGQDVTQNWRLEAARGEFDLTALTYTEQGAEKKLIYFSNVIAGEDALRPLGRLAVAPGFDVNVALVAGDSPRLVWWYWWVDGNTATGAFKTKLLQLQAMLAGDPSAALITLSIPCDAERCAEQAKELQPFVEQVLLQVRTLGVAR